MSFAKPCVIAAATALVVGLSGTATRANTIQPLLENVFPSGGNFVYTYRLELTPNNGLLGGITHPSALVIVDFPGIVSVQPSKVGADITATGDWSLQLATTGAGTLPDWSLTGGTFNLIGYSGFVSTPDGADPNIVLQYTGGGVSVDPTQRQLLHLTITSSATPNFTLRQSLSRNSSFFVENEVNTFPLLTGFGGVPEPASLGMLGIGAAALLARRRR
jgi:hypothetical protein